MTATTTSQSSELKDSRAYVKARNWYVLGGVFHLSISTLLLIQYGVKHAALWWVAVLLGFTFYRSGYGFTRAWRNLMTCHSTVGVRAHLLWVVLASCLIFPVFRFGWFGSDVFDIMRPVGLMMLSGAFLFGIGMQVAGSCTSGSMYRSGSGQFRLWFSIFGIITGAFFASLQYGNWTDLPIFFVYSYQRELPLLLAIGTQIFIVAILWLLLHKLEKRWCGNVTGIFDHDQVRSSLAGINQSLDVEAGTLSGKKHWLFERWTLGAGSIMLAVLSLIALILLNRPWVISLAFPFWSAKLASFAGLEYDFEFWDYWGIPQNESMLSLGLFEDVTSLMNFGFILGASWATLSLIKHVSNANEQGHNLKDLLYRPVVTFVGGLFMGYGAIIGLGCNIGGFIAAVLSGSVHGWAWVVAALCGTMVGVWLRRLLRI